MTQARLIEPNRFQQMLGVIHGLRVYFIYMARDEISNKLAKILANSDWSEPLVVYFFVQLRKLLDHRENEEDKFPNLRFYCDWVVHISKDRINKSTLVILRNLQTAIETQINNPTLDTKGAINFAYFEHLQPEIIALMRSEGIPVESLETSDNWTTLISHLVKVLENQPLVIKSTHGLNISKIVFKPSNPRCIIMLVIFTQPLKGKDGKDIHWFRLRNVY